MANLFQIMPYVRYFWVMVVELMRLKVTSYLEHTRKILPNLWAGNL